MSVEPASIVSRIKRAAASAVRAAVARQRLTEAAYPTAPGWVCELRSLRWLDDDRFELTGWAYDPAVDYTGLEPEIRVWAETKAAMPQFVTLATETVPSPEANQPFNGAKTDADYSRTCFRAVGSAAELVAAAADQEWPLRVSIAVPGHAAQGPFKKRYSLGSAGYLTSRRSGAHTVVPAWTAGVGLALRVRPQLPTAVDVSHDAGTGAVRITVQSSGPVASAVFATAQGRVPIDVHREGDRVVLSGTLPAIDPARDWAEAAPAPWVSPLVEELGADQCVPWAQARVLVSDGHDETPVVIGSNDLIAQHPAALEPGPEGELRFGIGSIWAVVTDVDLVGGDEPKLAISGRCHGDLTAVDFALANERDHREAALTQEGDAFTVVIPFLVSRWNLPALPPQIGRISLRARTADGRAVPVRCAPWVIDRAPDSILNKWFRLYFAFTPGKTLAPRLEIPIRDDEIGTHNQARIQQQYLSGSWPIVDQMYFESFYGRQCGCSPLALREELAAQHPRVPRVWAVRDLSVAVPEGDRAVVDATTDWWRARAESRWLVVNDWLRARFAHRDGQTVLQTWHGTMYKKVGLDRGEQLDAEEKEFMLGERTKWDLLLSQNPHSTRVFRESYLSNPPIYEEGYPRNDLLVNGDGGPIREALGIRPEQKVILYAPTWRDDRTELVDYLDVTRLAADLGGDYVVLLRAHSRVIRVGSAAKVGTGVIDVSTYPNTTDLLLIADVMITDYSSIMFDYAVTGRPMIFFTPDMDQYRDQLRGVYLDLEKVGPGPVVSTQGDVLAAILDIDQVAATFAARYAQWQADYTPWDDGQSSQRVLARYLQDAPPADQHILD